MYFCANYSKLLGSEFKDNNYFLYTFIINFLNITIMRKITLLLFALFAAVGSAFAADIPASGTVGYLYNKSTGKFITASATIDELGVAFKLKNEGTEADGFHSDEHVFSDPGHVYTYVRFEQNESSGNFFRLLSDGFTCNGSGYHKWAAEDRAEGWVIRCIYDREAQIKYDGAEQGHYLAINAEGTALTMVAEPTTNSYWQFMDEASYQAIAAGIIAAREAAEIKATQDALAAMNDGAGLKSGDEITILLKNPNFTDGGTGWDVNNGKIEKKGSSDNPVVTAFNYTFDVSQTIKGLPAGNYKVKAQAFSRPTTNQGSLDLLAEGAELENNCVLYANGVEKYVMQLTDEHLTEAGSGTWSSHEVGGATIYLPNNGGAFSDAFSRGMYENELDFTVGTDGILTLGIKNTKSPSGQGETYCGYDNFRLFYIGEDPATGISSVEKKAPVKAIFNIAGQQMDGLQKGLNIVDGQKVLVK